MATVADRVLDNGLTVLDTEASRVDITSQEATTYAEATSTYTLGNTTSISISAPADRTGGGRKSEPGRLNANGQNILALFVTVVSVFLSYFY